MSFLLTISISFILVLGAIYPIFETSSTDSSSNGKIIFFQQAHAERSGQPGSSGKSDLTSHANGGNGGFALGGTANGGNGASDGNGNGGNGGLAIGPKSDASGTSGTGNTNRQNGGVAVAGGHTNPASGCNVAVSSHCF